MIAVDTNILVYAHREDSPWHEAAYGSVVELAEGQGLPDGLTVDAEGFVDTLYPCRLDRMMGTTSSRVMGACPAGSPLRCGSEA